MRISDWSSDVLLFRSHRQPPHLQLPIRGIAIVPELLEPACGEQGLRMACNVEPFGRAKRLVDGLLPGANGAQVDGDDGARLRKPVRVEAYPRDIAGKAAFGRLSAAADRKAARAGRRLALPSADRGGGCHTLDPGQANPPIPP